MEAAIELFSTKGFAGTGVDEIARLFAFEFVSPITMLIQLYDRDSDQKEYVMNTLDKHIDVFIDRFFLKKNEK